MRTRANNVPDGGLRLWVGVAITVAGIDLYQIVNEGITKYV
jgi:hypothetical protein